MSHVEIVAVLIAPLTGILLFQWRIYTRFSKFSVEHEMLIDFYCKTTGIKRTDLPTRHNGVA